jgi:hypothetical protein
MEAWKLVPGDVIAVPRANVYHLLEKHPVFPCSQIKNGGHIKTKYRAWYNNKNGKSQLLLNSPLDKPQWNLYMDKLIWLLYTDLVLIPHENTLQICYNVNWANHLSKSIVVCCWNQLNLRGRNVDYHCPLTPQQGIAARLKSCRFSISTDGFNICLGFRNFWRIMTRTRQFLSTRSETYLHSMSDTYLHSMSETYLHSMSETYLHSMSETYLHSMSEAYLHSMSDTYLHSVRYLFALYVRDLFALYVRDLFALYVRDLFALYVRYLFTLYVRYLFALIPS